MGIRTPRMPRLSIKQKHIYMKRILFASFMTLGLLASGCGGGSDSVATTPAPAPVVTGPTALQVSDTVVGVSTTAVAGMTVTVHYTGWLYDAAAPNFRGAQFDSSIGKTPFSFKLGAGQVIQGWDVGVAGMKVGGTRTLIIPSAMAYGSAGVRGVIPANAALVFNVELLAAQ
jgi:FKBP-type peptidyl-prolyl cis-trans isomerase FkpA